MQIKATGAEAAVMFRQMYSEKIRTDERLLLGGAVAIDSVRETGKAHAYDGSTVVLWYKSSGKPTARAEKEAQVSTDMGIPRQMFMGKLIDIKLNKDQQVYFLVRAINRQGDDGKPCFRAFNPTKGDVLEITINPEPFELVRG